MSPLQIKMLLHYHYSPIDFAIAEGMLSGHPPAVAESLEMFVREGLLKSRYQDISWSIHEAVFIKTYNNGPVDKPIFSITDKGTAMVEHLCAVQIPICKWVQPETEQ
jgi:hypothetical protein